MSVIGKTPHASAMNTDIRDHILRRVAENTFVGCVVADDDGIIAGTTLAAVEARRLGLQVDRVLDEGMPVNAGDEIVRFRGNPKQVVMAEDVLIGLMAKSSGIATAAHRFVVKAGDRPKIVSGAWKKMPASQKESIRRAIAAGGALCRMSRGPFVYLDKNYIKLLGGIRASLEAIAGLEDREKVIQLKGRYADIVSEAREAVHYGAHILHIDTGKPHDIPQIAHELVRLGIRDRVKIAFSGNIKLEDLDMLKTLDIDLLDIGRKIVDAPLLDMRMEVMGNATMRGKR